MKRICLVLSCFILVPFFVFPAFTLAQSPDYLTPDQVFQRIKQIENKNPGVVSSTILTTSPGERPLPLIRIGKAPGANQQANPSIFVGANLEGNRPLATEGAVFLAETILSDPANYDSLNWYIIPLGNPDAAAKFFRTPLLDDSGNDLITNDDQDDQTDED